MIRAILNSLIKNHILANLIVLFLIVGGLISYMTLFREIQPQISDKYVKVDIEYPNADPQEVEESICLKLENAFSNIQGVKRYRTYSYEGGASAYVYPNDGYDINELKDEVQSSVDAISTFPDRAKRPVVKKQKFTPEVCAYTISGNVPEHQLRETAIKIKDDLLKLPHVSDVEVWGLRTPVISIEISERKLRKYGLTFDKVNNVIAKNGINVSAGLVKTKVEDIRIKAVGRKYQAKDYRNIPIITRPNGTTVKLDDIATINDSFDRDEDFFLLSEDNKPSVLLEVFRGENDDSMVTAAEVKDYLQKIEKKLPPTITINKFFDTTTYIDSLLQSFSSNGLVGLLLVVLLLWLFLDFRLSIWVALGIPVSLAGAFIFMAFTGVTLNFFSLFGLIMVVGIIVDDGIVVGETIFDRQIRGESPMDAAVNGTAHVAWPVIAAVLTTIISFIPLLYMTGYIKDLIKPIPIVVISALAISLVEALIVLPVHLRKTVFSYDLPKQKFLLVLATLRLRVNDGLNFCIEKIYSPFIYIVLRWRYTSICIGIFVVFVILGLIAGGKIKFQFWPRTESDMLKSKVELPAGTPTRVSREIAKKYYEAWKKTEKNFKTPNGKRPSTGFFAVVNSDQIDFFIPLVATEERQIPYMDLANAWEKEVGVMPEISKASFSGMGGSQDSDIELNLYGTEQKTLLEAANKLVEKLKTYNGTFEVRTSYEYGKRMAVLKLKPAAYYSGLSLNDIASQIASGFSGKEVMKIQRGRDEIKVNLSYRDKRGLSSVKYFRNVRIKTPEGKEIPLYDLVTMSLETSPSSINRENGKVYIRVYARVNENIGNAKEIREDIEKNYLPKLTGIYDISYGHAGQTRRTSELFARMVVVVPLAVLAIYFILVLIFNSYLQPVVIMFTIPFGIIGAIIGLTIFGLPISMMGVFGIVALTGVVVNDAIVLINEVNDRLKAGLPFFEAVREGSKRRVRAILLTTMTTFLGLMPLAFQQSFTAQMLKPMAVTIAFGILFTTLVTLILVPSIFAVLNDFKRGCWFIWNLKLPTREHVEPACNSECIHEYPN